MAFRHPATKLILFGWVGFISENLILSHNRKEIIESIGDDNYHRIYNSLSTVACGSIAYGFLKYRNNGPLFSQYYPRLHSAMSSKLMRIPSIALRIIGLVGFSQLFPKLQTPVAYAVVQTDKVPSPKIVARCPMDFNFDKNADAISGWKRVTRHPALMSLGLFSFSFALTTPFVSSAIMFAMPLAFAFIGGAHQDYRFKRGDKGDYDEQFYKDTSLAPFQSLLCGSQKWGDLYKDMKGLNATLAVLLALIF
ncbi:CAAX prenyl protease [Boothiomyces macroporosus]|uniref:CAAX prenyl protease n=1 Tax=Boothiomyces macroporosus TaxID=261099 RepID=A0AAD5UK98_9FUNG|nr:CAAX prenyl protease [Boothiomyces macroporosus]